jgi:hypothetical protein
MERASYYQRYGVILCFPGLRLQHTQLVRNKVNLQAYQREYAQRKRALRRRKVSKAERVLSEEHHGQIRQLMGMEDLPAHPKAEFCQYVWSLLLFHALTHRNQGLMYVPSSRAHRW